MGIRASLRSRGLGFSLVGSLGCRDHSQRLGDAMPTGFWDTRSDAKES